MAADEKALGELHNQVAKVLSKALEGQTIAPEEGSDEAEIFIPPSAAIIQAATKFLKDNNITSTPSKDNALGALEEQLRKQKERRTVGVVDRAQASEHMGFMSGLPIGNA